MYHTFANGVTSDGRLPRGQMMGQMGQTGLSPYQNRSRLQSKHGQRSHKRRNQGPDLGHQGHQGHHHGHPSHKARGAFPMLGGSGGGAARLSQSRRAQRGTTDSHNRKQQGGWGASHGAHGAHGAHGLMGGGRNGSGSVGPRTVLLSGEGGGDGGTRAGRSLRGRSSNKLPSIAAGQGGKGLAMAAQFNTKDLTVVHDKCGLLSGCCTIQGLKPGNPNWQNQDNFVLEESLGGSGTRCFVVLDGHGEVGHLVSRRCIEHIPKLLLDSGYNPTRALLNMHSNLGRSGLDCSCSGATCVMATIKDGTITVANLGDSRCVLGRMVRGQLNAVQLSHDHKPDRPDERDRIVAVGGQVVGSRHLIVGNGRSGAIRIPVGPSRVWYTSRGETMGLAMSRSLGDNIAHDSGVSAEAEVITHVMDANDQFLILGSDGVWDVIDINQSVQLVHGYIAQCEGKGSECRWDPQDAASLVAHTARKRWEGMSAMVDDITCVVVKLAGGR
ncbi:unnamed protein product [Chrysoparadoxa australica]